MDCSFFQLTIVSAHRTPERMYAYSLSAKERGLEVIIAGAGGAAHLPGKCQFTGKNMLLNSPYCFLNIDIRVELCVFCYTLFFQSK